MTKAERMTYFELEVRKMLRRVYMRGTAEVLVDELMMWLDRKRETSGFISDLKELWSKEMQDCGFESDELPRLKFTYEENTRSYVFAWGGEYDKETQQYTQYFKNLDEV